MSTDQKMYYESSLTADLILAEMIQGQGNNDLAEMAYNNAIGNLLPLKGWLPQEKFNMYLKIITEGLEHVYRSILKEEAGLESLPQAEKLLKDHDNPLVIKYNERKRELSEVAEILENSLPLHEVPC